MNELFKAILNKDIVSLNQVLNSGYNVNDQDEDGRTALMEAIIEGDKEIVKLLLEHGADVNRQDYIAEISALHFAVQNSSYELVKLLLDNHAEIEIEDVNGNTPLSDAVFYSKGKGEIIKLLLEHGADRNKQNKHGVSPLSLAESIGNYNVIQYFE